MCVAGPAYSRAEPAPTWAHSLVGCGSTPSQCATCARCWAVANYAIDGKLIAAAEEERFVRDKPP